MRPATHRLVHRSIGICCGVALATRKPITERLPVRMAAHCTATPHAQPIEAPGTFG